MVVIVEESVAKAAAVADEPSVRVVPRASADRRRSRGLDADAVLDVIRDAGPRAVILARPVWADPAVAALPVLGAVADRDVVWLPEDHARAAWATALISRWAPEVDRDDLVRRAQVAVGLAGLPSSSLPLRPWGLDGQPVPAVRADALARWCACAWRRCDWCEAGGVADAPCPACGHAGAAS